jgi:hypothetical protein
MTRETRRRFVQAAATAVLAGATLAPRASASPEDAEPNDTFEQADAAPLGEPMTGLLESGGIDTFETPAVAGDAYRVRFGRASTEGVVAVGAWDADRRLVNLYRVAGPGPIAFPVRPAVDGPLFTRVVDVSSEGGTYTLVVDAPTA